MVENSSPSKIESKTKQHLQIDSSYSPPRSAHGRTAGFPTKRVFKTALKNASFNLNEDDYDIHTGMSPEPRFMLGLHPRSKQLVFRDMNFETYNPKVGYMYKDGPRRRLYSISKADTSKTQSSHELSPESKLFNNMLERTPFNNLKFSDKLAMELENEGRSNEINVKENMMYTSPSRAERIHETTKYHLSSREVPQLDRNIHSAKNEQMSMSLVEKRPLKKAEKIWKLEPIHPKNTQKRALNQDYSFDNGYVPINKRKFSHDLGGNEGRKLLNVRPIALKEGKSFNVDYPEPLHPSQEGLSNDKNKNSKKNFHLFRQALSKTLFKRRRDNSQTSNVVQRLFYNSILTKGLAE